jgi:hypothetical protein
MRIFDLAPPSFSSPHFSASASPQRRFWPCWSALAVWSLRSTLSATPSASISSVLPVAWCARLLFGQHGLVARAHAHRATREPCLLLQRGHGHGRAGAHQLPPPSPHTHVVASVGNDGRILRSRHTQLLFRCQAKPRPATFRSSGLNGLRNVGSDLNFQISVFSMDRKDQMSRKKRT